MDNKPSYGSQRCDDPLKRSKKSRYTAPFMVTWVILPSKAFKELMDTHQQEEQTAFKNGHRSRCIPRCYVALK